MPAGTADLNYPRADRADNPETPMFSAVQIKGGVLYYTAYTVNGGEVKKIDAFAIQKDMAQGEKLPLTEWPVQAPSLEGAASGVTKVLNFMRKLVIVFRNLLRVFAFGSTEPPIKLPECTLPDSVC